MPTPATSAARRCWSTRGSLHRCERKSRALTARCRTSFLALPRAATFLLRFLHVLLRRGGKVLQDRLEPLPRGDDFGVLRIRHVSIPFVVALVAAVEEPAVALEQ